MHRRNWNVGVLLLIWCATSCVVPLHAQNIISTIAGGGPNNIPALSASTGNAFGVASDGKGNLYVSAYISGGSGVFKIDAAGNLTVAAGNGTVGFSGDNGPATSAALDGPTRIAVDGSGNIFIPDYFNNRIREVVAATGVIKTVAGNGTAGFAGDNGPAISAELNFPRGVALDGSGNIYIADTSNERVREVVAATGVIKTVAGNGTAGFVGGLATNAELSFPEGVAVDGLGNIYIADEANNCIREVVAATGVIKTVAGNGTVGFSGDGGLASNAEFDGPADVSLDASGNIFIADYFNSRIREVAVATGLIQTVAGNGTADFSGDGGLATSAELDGPLTVSVDGSENIYIADNLNNRVRQVLAATNVIKTIVGNGTLGFSGEGVSATSAQLDYPIGVFSDASGNIFVADADNNRLRKVVAGTNTINTVAGNGAAGFSGDGGLATSTELHYPVGVSVDGLGNIFIADQLNSRLREVVAATGDIRTVAGNGTAGFFGDGGPAAGAELFLPWGLAADGQGNVFIADFQNNRIREVVAKTGIITTVAGNGIAGFAGDNGLATSAQLDGPTGVAVDGFGNIFIADEGNNRIREVVVATDNIVTVGGNGTFGFSGDGGLATTAELSNPSGVFVDTLGNIFISDLLNYRIREIVAATGVIQTVAGNGIAGFSGDGGPAASAEIYLPNGLTGDRAGNLYISDGNSNRIRRVSGLVAVVAVTSVLPGSPTVLIGANQTFNANVTGATDTSVTWTVSGNGCSGNGCGTISLAGIYTAPASVPSPATVVVTATSNVDSSKSATATATIASNVVVQVAPSATFISANTTQQFTAMVTGTPNNSVIWSLSGSGCSGGPCGRISSTGGLYSAPSNTTVSVADTVIATSVVDASKSGMATVRIPTGPAIAPSTSTVNVTQGGKPPSNTATVDINLSGGPGDAGLIFSSITCSLPSSTGAPTCSVSPQMLNLDGNGNGIVHVTVTVPGSTSFVTPQSGNRLLLLFAALFALSGLTLALRKLRCFGSWTGWATGWKVAIPLLTFLVMLSMGSCGGGGSSSSSPTASSTYTVTVTINSNSITPPLSASGTFSVTVLQPGVFTP